MHQFNEHHSDFDGFSEYFENNIRSRLEVAEKTRIIALKRVFAFAVCIFTICMLIGVTSAYRMDDSFFLVFSFVMS